MVALHAEVDVLVIEGDPQLGSFAGRLSFTRVLLDEFGERQHLLIHVVVESRVDPERCRDASGRDRDVRRGLHGCLRMDDRRVRAQDRRDAGNPHN